MCTNAKAIYFVTLLVQTQNGILVDVIRSHNGQLIEPWNFEAFRHLLECFPRQAGQIGQIPGIDPYAQGMISQIIESQGHGTEIQQATPRENKNYIK